MNNNVKGFLFFGDPKKGAQCCIQLEYRPNRLQRFMLRKLLNMYYIESA